MTVPPGVLFGVAGWSYPDWRGVVYPKGKVDALRFVARHVDVLEINNTFYRVPDAEPVRSWVERTADLGTRFTAKVPREVSHEGRADDRLLGEIAAGFAPLAGSGRLLTLLLQFGPRFEWTVGHAAFLDRVVPALAAVAPVTVEVRHRSWNARAALDHLEGLAVAVANLDYPGAATGFGPDVTGIDGRHGLAYFRLHGRNAAAWFARDADRDRVYDHEYGPGELDEIRARLGRIAANAPATVAVANNHFHGKAFKLVLELLAWYRGGRVDVPDTMVQHFPDLARIAGGHQGTLW